MPHILRVQVRVKVPLLAVNGTLRDRIQFLPSDAPKLQNNKLPTFQWESYQTEEEDAKACFRMNQQKQPDKEPAQGPISTLQSALVWICLWQFDEPCQVLQSAFLFKSNPTKSNEKTLQGPQKPSPPAANKPAIKVQEYKT